MKTGRQDLFGCRIGKQIAGELFDRELVKRHVVMEGLDDPVAPRPVAAIGILLIPIGIGIACGIEPPHRHPFAVVRRLEQSIDRRFISPRRLVSVGRICGGESLQFGDRRWQPGEVERGPAKQRVGLRRGSRLQPFLLKLDSHERIDGMQIGYRDLAPDWGLERPMSTPRGTFVDPPAERLDLRLAERLSMGVRGGHPQIRIVAGHPHHEFTLVRVFRHDRCEAPQILHGSFPQIQPQTRLSVGLIRSVTVEAAVRQDRQHLAAEAHRLHGRQG